MGVILCILMLVFSVYLSQNRVFPVKKILCCIISEIWFFCSVLKRSLLRYKRGQGTMFTIDEFVALLLQPLLPGSDKRQKERVPFVFISLPSKTSLLLERKLKSRSKINVLWLHLFIYFVCSNPALHFFLFCGFLCNWFAQSWMY